MGADTARSPGSFRRLGERLLGEVFPDRDAEEVDRYLDRAVARVREVASVEPQQRVRASRVEVLEAMELGRRDFHAAHSPAADTTLTPADLVRHLATRQATKLVARRLIDGYVGTLDIHRILNEAGGALAAIELPASSSRDLASGIGSRSASARDDARAAADLAAELDGVRNLMRAVDLSIDVAIDLASGLADRDLDRCLADARASTRTLDQSLGLDHVLARYLHHDLEKHRSIRLDRPAYAEVDRDRDRGHLLRLAESIAFAGEAVQEARRALVEEVARMFRPIGRLDLGGLTDESARALREAVNDFSGADLRNVDLAGVDLRGVRWSPTTFWPEEWRERIAQESVAISHGMFQVHPPLWIAEAFLAVPGSPGGVAQARSSRTRGMTSVP